MVKYVYFKKTKKTVKKTSSNRTTYLFYRYAFKRYIVLTFSKQCRTDLKTILSVHWKEQQHFNRQMKANTIYPVIICSRRCF